MTFLFVTLGILCFAQGGYLRPNTNYGTRQYRLGIDSTLFYPTGNGAPTTLRGYDLKQGALYFDSTNNKVYNYNPKTSTWSMLGGDVPTLQKVTEQGDTTDGYINITGNSRYGLTNTEGMMLSYNKSEGASYIESFNDASGKFHPVIFNTNIGETASPYSSNSLKLDSSIYWNSHPIWYSGSIAGVNGISISGKTITNGSTLQQITNNGAVTTNNVTFGTNIGGNNVSVNYNNSSQAVMTVQNTNTGTSSVMNVNSLSSGSGTEVFTAGTNGVFTFEVRGNGLAKFNNDLQILTGTTSMRDAIIQQHLYFTNSTPTVSLASGASWTGTYTISGSRDQTGKIGIVITSGTGSVGASGNLLNITFGSTFAAGVPNIIVVPADVTTKAAFAEIYANGVTTSGWSLQTTPSLSGIPAGQYFFNYHVF